MRCLLALFLMIRLISLEPAAEERKDKERNGLGRKGTVSGCSMESEVGLKRKRKEFVKVDISSNCGFKQSLRVTEEGKSSV